MSFSGIIGKGLTSASGHLGRGLGAGLLLACLLGSGSAPVAGDRDTFETASKLVTTQERRTGATYSVKVGFDGEVFPALANYAALRTPDKRPWGVVIVEISNSTAEALKQRVTVEVPGWSDREIQFVELSAGERRTLRFAPTFHPRLFRNREIVAATAAVSVVGGDGHVTYETTVPVHLRSVDDMYWGRDFDYAQHIASWVTPHDPAIERLLAVAKEKMPGRRLPGYEPKKTPQQQEQSIRAQMRAVYEAVQGSGLSYVKSSITFGENTDFTQRVRMPGESLRQRSANCIDGVVTFASLFENLGMDPVVVVVPGHAYVGVRSARGSQKLLFLETSLTGRASFEAATAAAERGILAIPPRDVLKIAITDARGQGVYPMPTSASLGEEEEALAVAAAKKQAPAFRLPKAPPKMDAARRKGVNRQASSAMPPQ